jgi:hypothetical protein
MQVTDRGGFGILFCPNGDTAVELLGFALKQAVTASVGMRTPITSHPDYIAAKAWHDDETSFWSKTMLTPPGTGGCEQIVQDANAHLARVNALIRSAQPGAATFNPGSAPPDGEATTLVKLGLTAAIVLGVAYVAGPIVGAIFGGRGGRSRPAMAGYRRR